MADDIVLTREKNVTLDLDPTEKALMDEIELKHRPAPTRVPRREVPRHVPQIPRPPADVDDFINEAKRDEVDDQEGSFTEEGSFSEGPDDMPRGPQPSAGYKTIEDEKADLLNKIERLIKKGLKSSEKLNAYSDIELIRTEYKRMMYHVESEQAIKLARRILIACTTGIEFINRRFDPFDLKLDGWSENMMENVDDYDQVFEELHDKYKEKVKVAPEIKLILMVGGSAMMFHLSKKMFAGFDAVNPTKILKENPDLMKNMMDAVKKSQEQTPPTFDQNGRREMKGPGFDLGSLMGGFMPPPMPENTRPVVREETIDEKVVSEDELSDIISINSDTKDITLKTRKRKGSKDKKVLVL
jgi:Family of unknown function (DUF5767)